MDKVSYLCVRLREDVKAEIEVTTQTQREIHGQKQQAERLAAQALKTTHARAESLATDSSGLKGGNTPMVLDLANELLSDRIY